jgi:acyl-coenzyme A synthetase/AMP-(fatty) acid ligase
VSLQDIHALALVQPTKPAVIYNDNIVSYTAFAGAILETARYLETLKLPAGQTVIVMVDILLDCWVVVLALQALGLQTVCISSPELIETLGFQNVAGIASTELESTAHELSPSVVAGNRIITIPNPSYKHSAVPEISDVGRHATPGGHILYTSGTTGTYKKIFWAGDLQRRRNAERIQVKAAFDTNTTYYCADFGLWTAAGYKNALAIWHTGGCVIIDQRPQWYQYFLTHAITHTTLIPDKVHQLLDFVQAEQTRGPAGDFELLITGGFISRKLAEQVIRHLTSKLLNTYGSTEMSILMMQSAVTELDDLHWLTPTRYRRVEIVDDSGMPCPIGVEGQLRVRLTDLDCSSYLDDPLVSERVFKGGYFYPGDMALQRADGRIRILRRSADVLNIRDQKHSVAPLEHEIQHRLGVDAVCLFCGMNIAGEEEVVIVIQAEQWPTESNLNQLGKDSAQFERVRFALVPKFPRTRTGTSKIDRIALRKLKFPVGGD